MAPAKERCGVRGLPAAPAATPEAAAAAAGLAHGDVAGAAVIAAVLAAGPGLTGVVWSGAGPVVVLAARDVVSEAAAEEAVSACPVLRLALADCWGCVTLAALAPVALLVLPAFLPPAGGSGG